MRSEPVKDGGRGLARGKPSAKEQVYLYVRDLIMRGEVPGGAFIEEEQITEATGVSRTPVREAFLRLEAERFLDLIPRRGAQVRQITAQELMNVYEARRVIEVHVARRVCDERLEVPPAMTTLMRGMEEVAGANGQDLDYARHIELDVMFHRALVAAAGNDVLLEVYDALQVRKMRVAYTALRVGPARMALIMSQHQALLEALHAHDADAAAAVLEEHLKPVVEVISLLPSR
ncbi:hypothetical protein CBF45_02170 [Bordetella sp. J329]|nr:hypothetical protein CBF45_02170 [Bordetella sp. J329]